MSSVNPRGLDQWSGRVQEFTGGHHPREMVGDYDVNPNENSDGLAHHSQQGTSTEDFRTQIDPKKRREKALKDMEGEIPHISIKPEEIEETLSRSPSTDVEGELYESAMGVDMGHASNGIGISAGAHTGPVRREGPGLLFGRSKEEAFEDAWSLVKNRMAPDDQPSDDEQIAEMARRQQERFDDEPEEFGVGALLHTDMGFGEVNMPRGQIESTIDTLRDLDEQSGYPEEGDMPPIPPSLVPFIQQELKDQIGDNLPPSMGQEMIDTASWFVPNPEKHSKFRSKLQEHEGPGANENLLPHSKLNAPTFQEYTPPAGLGAFGMTPKISEDWQEFHASEEGPTFISDVLKAKKRKKRGRKYEEDEESEEEERTSKKKRKREQRRKMKGKKTRGSRDIKGKTARRAASAEQNLNRHTKRQAFSPRRMYGGNPRGKDIPLRIRDPVAYQRKLANERMARSQGALPRDMTRHRDTRGIHGKIQTIGMGTKLPSQPSSSKGTKFKKPKSADREGSLIHDPLGGDPLKMLLAKAATMESRARSSKISQAELHKIKGQLKKLIAAVERLSKSGPELGEEAKRGAKGDKDKNTAPRGPTSIPEDREPWNMVCDTTVMPAAGAAGAGKR
tara:strand:+ start:4731 stop:6587 length:1857 start_codon:yes stop_codon:yes gene_type:complete